MNHYLIVLIAVVTLMAGCATGDSARQARAEFEDVPVPHGLTYLEKESIVVDAPGAKVARMVYRGRVQMGTLAMSMRGTLENNGWRKVGSSTTTAAGTTQLYEKERSSLQVRLWENFLFTYVEVTTSRLMPLDGSTAPAGPVVPAVPGSPTSSIAPPPLAAPTSAAVSVSGPAEVPAGARVSVPPPSTPPAAAASK